ncbi:MAG: glycosyltransferase family 2 protein, partial [Desulfobulbaceae bacterium]|nr:glycosyltransferase family 2 protein [Desulfobulbaceae bacterium]
MTNPPLSERIAVVIPSYKVTRQIGDVILKIPDMVWRIYVIDDACPEGSGKFVKNNIDDDRVRVICHAQNQGVGGAVMSGYQAAITDGAEVIVKVDGDGQMDPSLIPYFIKPILAAEADYTKGNRFYDLEEIRAMPFMRL